MNEKRGYSTVGSMGFAGVLTIVFIVLKLLHKIEWSWVWVLSPLWISWALSLIVIAIIFLIWKRNN